MKASMMLTHTKPRPPLPIPLRPRLIPKPSAPTARGIPSNVQIRKVASPTWKPLFLIMMYIRIRISVQEWSIGDSRWFSHGQSDQWFADRQTSGPNRRSGQVRSGQVRSEKRTRVEPLSGPYRIEGVRGRSLGRGRVKAELSKAVRWQAGGYSIQVAATRPRALKYRDCPIKQRWGLVIGFQTRARGRQSRRRVAGVSCYSACIADLRPVSWGPGLHFI